MIDYTLVRSNRRSMALEVRDGRVTVRAPKTVTRRQIEQFVSSHTDWLEKHLAQSQKRLENHPEPDPEQVREYIKKAKELLPKRVAYYSEIMGLSPAGITITGARTRFGSCGSNKRVSFSWRLMQYPDAAIDYVVVHELAHLRYMNHGKEFYSLIEKYMPDYKSRRQLLRE